MHGFATGGSTEADEGVRRFDVVYGEDHPNAGGGLMLLSSVVVLTPLTHGDNLVPGRKTCSINS